MKTLTVKLPDGTTESRKSDRPYTHAIIVVVTEERRRLVLDKIEKTIAEHEAVLAANAPLVDLPEQVAAYAAAKARLDFLDEEVTETYLAHRTNEDGSQATYQHTCARWLARSYRNQVGTEDERRRGRVDMHGDFYGDTAGLHKRDADAALLATARGKVEKATAELARAREFYDRRSGQLTVGRASVHGWSQSAKNAAKAEQTAREENPGAHVFTTTAVSVHVPKARAGKGQQA
jgi:hypothetical protein